MLTPRLPAGFHAQPSFHTQEGWTSFDFYRVYNVARELDPMRSYWLMLTSEDSRGPQPPAARWLSFADWAKASHKSADDYADFQNPQTPLATIRRWVETTRSGDLVEVTEL